MIRLNIRSPWLAWVVLCGLSASAGAQAASASKSFLAKWQARATAAQDEQPHWITTVVTVSPKVDQAIRSDFVRQTNSKGYNTWNYGNSRGLELIPERHIELLFSTPPFFNHAQPGVKDGFGDIFLLMKYRIFARNEQHGNGIVSMFLAATVPTGKDANGSCCAIVTPTLAVGKGFGQLALTSLLGGSLPVSNAHVLGHTISWNSAVQYHLAKRGMARFFWPEVEFNSSFYQGGSNDGKIATFGTPGLMIGRIPLSHDESGKAGRLGLSFGAAEQIALTQFHTYNHGVVLTLRMPF
jgi:hypothetical protein